MTQIKKVSRVVQVYYLLDLNKQVGKPKTNTKKNTKHNKLCNTNILLNTDYSQDVAVPQVHRDTNSASAPQYEK